jgi:hypothetical protein
MKMARFVSSLSTRRVRILLIRVRQSWDDQRKAVAFHSTKWSCLILIVRCEGFPIIQTLDVPKVQVAPISSIMTIIVGLKRILFPLQDGKRTAKRPSNSSPTVQRNGAARISLMAGGDSLANLGAISSKPTKKIRRDKRQRDKENMEGVRAMPITLNPMTKTAIMDSLAFLGARMSSKPPKPISPSSIDVKSKMEKQFIVKGKKSKNGISGTRMAKNKKNGLMNASDGTGMIRSKTATKNFSASAGLGAMFGAEFLAPIRTQPTTMSVDRPAVIETNPNNLGIVSPLAVPRTNIVASEVVHSSHCLAHSTRESAKTRSKTKKKKGALKKKKTLDSIGGRTESKVVSVSIVETNESEKPKRRSKHERRLVASEETLAQGITSMSMCSSPKIASNRSPEICIIPTDVKSVRVELPIDKLATLRRSKRRLSADNRYRTSPDKSSSSREPHLEPKEVASEQGDKCFLKAPLASSFSSSNSTTANANVSERLRRSVAPVDRLGNPVHNPDEMRTLRRGIRPKNKANGERSIEASSSNEGKVTERIKEACAKRSIEIDSSAWSSKELEMLRKSYHDANPKSSSFWDDVAQLVGSKTADECQEKWFSFAKTPNQAPRKSKKMKTLAQGTPSMKEDDIFNATPMKTSYDLSFIFGSGLDLSNAEGLASFGIGSAIKVNVERASDKTGPQLNTITHGYKTYIKNVKRDVNNCIKHKFPKAPKTKKIKETVTLKDAEGDFEVRGKLSPGGTLQVATESLNHHDFRDDENMYLSGDECDEI